MIGVLTERPAFCVAGGVVIAAIVVGVQGLEAVESDWRLRGFHNDQDVERVEVSCGRCRRAACDTRRATSVGCLFVIVEPSTGRDSAG